MRGNRIHHEGTKDTKVSDYYFSDLRAFVVQNSERVTTVISYA